MKLESGYISLNNMRFHAFHGVLPQETQVGNECVVTLRVGYPLATAMESDEVDDTLNYSALYLLVEKEMAQPSKLLEHVAGRIAASIKETFPLVISVDLWITKQNPPMGADCDGAEIEMHFINE